jgi:branched-chain amino acid transport system substrate-binding protein
MLENNFSRSLFGIVVLSLVSFVSCKSDAKKDEITIGAILSLSGNASEQGQWVKQGIEIALKEVNEDPSSKKLSVEFQDSRGADQQVAVSAYQFLRQIYSIPAVLSWGSPIGMVLSPRVNQDKVIQIGVATSTPLYSSEGDYTFRTYPVAGIETDVLVSGIKKLSSDPKIGLFYMLSDYGQGMRKSFLKSLEKENLSLAVEDSFNPKDTDFKAQILKFKAAEVNTVLIFGYLNEGALILRQLKELGVKANILAGSAMFGGGDFIELTKGSSENLIVSGIPIPEEGGYPAKYRAFSPDAHSFPAIMVSAFSYEAIKIYSKAVNSCNGSDPHCIKNYFLNLKNYPGALGNWSFDKNGDVDVKFGLFKIEGGEFHEIH